MEKHDTLLVFSPSRQHREHLRSVFQGVFHLLETGSTQQTMLLLRQNLDCIAAVLMDITDMQYVDADIIHQEDNVSRLEKVPVIVLSENDDPNILNRAFGFGAADVIPIGYDPSAMLHRVETIVDLNLHKQHLETMVAEQKNLIRHTSDTMVDALSSIIEYRSVESGQHILRIRHFTKILLEEVARVCPEYQLNDEIIALICSASALHDIGKIAIPDAILMKPDKLTAEEMEEMKTHTLTGCQILDTLGGMADQEYLRYAHNICHYHHERWDGKGYPEGLEGENIPICAQVVGLADVYDALTSKRVYKDAYSVSKAVNMIVQGECGLFSPKLLECFKHVTPQFEKLARAYGDGMAPAKESFDTSLPLPSMEQQQDALERLRGKYYALVHFINGFLMELDMDRQLFHLIYNPYPELDIFQEMNSMEDIRTLILRKLVHPSDKERMVHFLDKGISRFLDEGLRRFNYRFQINSETNPQGEALELTLLRINPLDTSRRTLAVLARKIEAADVIQSGSKPGAAWNGYTCCYRNDESFTLLEMGAKDSQLIGYSEKEIREQFDGSLLQLIYPEDRAMFRQELVKQWARGTQALMEFRAVHKDGTIRWVYSKNDLVLDENGQETVYSLILDISKSRRFDSGLEDKLRRYEIILAQTENVLFEWDVERDELMLSDTWERIFGFPPSGSSLYRIIHEDSCFHPDDVPLLVDRINQLEAGSSYEMVEVRIATARGRYLWCRIRATAIRNNMGKIEKISGVVINIDAEKQAAQLLQSRAEQDSLTKLLNKDAARKQAEAYYARFPKGVNSALMIIDLDNFKQINDQYGHLFGDAVLTQVAREIRKLFRGQDIVARIGGDEFMVLMRGVTDRVLLEQRCKLIVDSFRNMLQNQNIKIAVGCSIGIAISPDHGNSYYELFQHADQALYRVKNGGKNGYAIYDPNDSLYELNYRDNSKVNSAIDSDAEPGMADDNIVRYAFQKLYDSQNVEQSIGELLGMIGKKLNVSRVYVFENSDDNRYCYNTYEWCNEGIQPEIDVLQNISYEKDIPGYTDNFDEDGIFYCPNINTLSKPVFDILEPQGIKSMLQCAIRENGVFRGYIGFDECVEQRLWTKDQINLLRFFSESMSMFLLRKRRQEKVQRRVDELHSILDNQNAWIYVVDPQNHKLLYANASLMEKFPGLTLGTSCYRSLEGIEKPCRYCPLAMLKDARSRCFLMERKEEKAYVLLETTKIKWEGMDACLISGRKLPGNTVSI